MKDGRQALSPGWQKCILAAVLVALAGSLLVRAISWPENPLPSHGETMEPTLSREAEFLWMTLVLVPVLERGTFHPVLYGWLRCFMALSPTAVISSLAFRMHHGNWIQGTYAFFLGMVLAWGHEGSEHHRYPMVALMHGAVNPVVLAAFG